LKLSQKSYINAGTVLDDIKAIVLLSLDSPPGLAVLAQEIAV
jgi:hypothetical protein